MKTMSAAIDIDAPPVKVWEILTDLGSYHQWNPLFVETGGNVAVGQRITLRSKHPANGRMMTVKPKITAVRSEEPSCGGSQACPASSAANTASH